MMEKLNLPQRESQPKIKSREEDKSNLRSLEKEPLTDATINTIMDVSEKKIINLKKQWEIKRELGVDPFKAEQNAVIEQNKEIHWTEALNKRMQGSDYKDKYLALSKKSIDLLEKYDATGALDKPKDTKKYYYDKIRSFDDDRSRVFSQTAYGPAGQFGKGPNALGVFYEGAPEGAVFSDSGLTDSQKMIIESHEKGHAMRTFPKISEIRDGFDYEKHSAEKRTTYLKNPDELLERMAQLKNYFGFTGNELFTRGHLDNAREQYITNTGLDNDMTDFFNMITKEKEDKFLEIINSWPV